MKYILMWGISLQTLLHPHSHPGYVRLFVRHSIVFKNYNPKEIAAAVVAAASATTTTAAVAGTESPPSSLTQISHALAMTIVLRQVF